VALIGLSFNAGIKRFAQTGSNRRIFERVLGKPDHDR